MEYKDVPTAEKGYPYPLNRTAAVHRIVYCILRNEFSRALQPCQVLSQCLDKVCFCVFLLLSSFGITAPIKRSRPRIVFELRIPSLLFRHHVFMFSICSTAQATPWMLEGGDKFNMGCFIM